ncbi:DUF2218 domain-containing protein [Actinomycetota bacterium]
MQTATGTMPTDRPERYAKQLASHWAAKTEVAEADGATVLTFPNGNVLTMRPAEGALGVEVAVPDDADLPRFQDVVARHLERFGQRDELTVGWD